EDEANRGLAHPDLRQGHEEMLIQTFERCQHISRCHAKGLGRQAEGRLVSKAVEGVRRRHWCRGFEWGAGLRISARGATRRRTASPASKYFSSGAIRSHGFIKRKWCSRDFLPRGLPC